MRARGLAVLVAVVVLMVLALWLWRPGSKHTAVDRAPAVEASQGPRVDLAPVADAREAVEAPSSAHTESALTVAADGPGRYEFDLTVIPVDGSGRPLASVEVRIGLQMHALALLGKTEWDGELHAKWRSFEPTVDLVLEARREGMGSSTLRHVHLIADAPLTIRLAVDISSSVPVLAQVPMVGSMFQGRSGETTLDSDVRFVLDSAGNGVFVDPSLVRAQAPKVSKVQDENVSAMEEPGRNLLIEPVQWIGRVEVSAELFGYHAEESAKLDITVRDENGERVPNVRVSVMSEAHAARGDSDTDSSGRVRTGVATGPVMVLAGGGLHAIVRQDLNIKAGETRVIEMRCPKLERTRVQLIDRSRQPLAGWHMESRETGGDGAFVDRDDTNAEGRAEIVIPSAGRGELFVRPYGGSTLPKLRIDTIDFAVGADNEIVLDQGAQHAQIVATILSADPTIEVRLWNTDSDEGMRLARSDTPKEEGVDTQAHVFRAGNLVPGRYVLEIGAPCVRWKRVGPFLLASGQVLDAGTYTLEQPAVVNIGDVTSSTGARAAMHAHERGLYFVGEAEVQKGADTLMLTAGEWTLSIRSPDAEAPKVLFGPRVIRAQSGRTIMLDPSESSAPR